ncbi:acyl-CoA dehydrogenase family protein [Amycolatopsis speibonae]|uniref:Acyl-CoA dehydrogenase family protein n=1 Tax=Amycolatopsis speibonae TaxID=1450224 RepID=A0ABV7PAX9_9PSEU
MDFGTDGRLTELRQSGYRAGRKLAKQSLTARTRKARWGTDLLDALARESVLGIALPAEYGGQGATVLETVFFLEGFGAGSGDMGLSTAIATHGVLCGLPIAVLGSASQRERYLPGMVSGARFGAVARATVDDSAVSPAQIVKVGSGKRLDARYTGVVNAREAKHFLVIADSGREQTACIVDRNSAGLTVRTGHTAASATPPTFLVAELELNNCHVPARAQLGSGDIAGVEVVPLLAALERTCLMAPWLGLLRELSGWAVKLVSDHPALMRSQSARMAVADLRAQTELAAGLLYRAAWQIDAPGRPSRQDSAVAKLFLLEALNAAARTAAELDSCSPRGIPAPGWLDMVLFSARGGDSVLRSVVAGSMLASG